MTFDLADMFYKRYLNFHSPPFSVWLEDVYIGMLASHFKTPINDIRPNLVPHEQYIHGTKEFKQDLINKKGISNTLFVYDKNSQTFFCNLFNIQHY